MDYHQRHRQLSGHTADYHRPGDRRCGFRHGVDRPPARLTDDKPYLADTAGLHPLSGCRRPGLPSFQFLQLLPMHREPEHEGLAAHLRGYVVNQRGLGVEIRGGTLGEAGGLPVTAQALYRRLAAAFAVVIEFQVVVGGTHALLDVQDFAERAVRTDVVEGVALPPIRPGELELDFAGHAFGVAEDQPQRVLHLLVALPLRQDEQGVEMQVGDPSPARPGAAGAGGLEIQEPLPIHALVMEAAVEEMLDVAAFHGKRRQAPVNPAIYEHGAVAIDGEQGRRDMELLQHIGLLLPNGCL